MAKVYTCPFFRKGPESLKKNELRCEGGKVRFPSDKAMKKYVRENCASSCFGADCSLYKMMMEHYDEA